MDDSASPMNGRGQDPTARDGMGDQPPPHGERARGPAPDGPADPPPPAVLQVGRVRRILPWVIAAVAVLMAAIAIGVLVVNESSEPKPVAQLTPQTDPAQGAIPLDDETARNFGVTEADFVSYGSYGELQIWSATTPEGKPCLAIVAEDSIIMLRCAAPTLDPVADLDLPSNMLPPAPSGEPTFNIRLVLHDDVVHVYLAPNPEGGYY